MHKLLKRLPAFKSLVLRSIASCYTTEQLEVAWEFIQLFQMRYTDCVDALELCKHYEDLQKAYLDKVSELSPSSVK
jgi:hypothetical protein